MSVVFEIAVHGRPLNLILPCSSQLERNKFDLFFYSYIILKRSARIEGRKSFCRLTLSLAGLIVEE